MYSTFLLHNPRPVGNLSIVRTNRAEVPIECRFPRSVREELPLPLVPRPLSNPVSLPAASGSVAARRWKGLGCGHCPQPWVESGTF